MSEDRREVTAPGPAVDEAPADPWIALRRATPARVGLGRSGDTVPLGPVLDFQLAHAAARDAVHAVLEVDALAAALAPRRVITARSAAPDRSTYLRRPDLGRALDAESRSHLEKEAGIACDCLVVIADGLSAVAVARHAVPLIERWLPQLGSLSVGPLVIASQARVALGDAIGEILRARLCIVLIGERPGLSVADSLGAYITFAPRIGRRDSERNCVSNIHANGGLSYDEAARKLSWLAREAIGREVTGIALKEAEASPDLLR